MMQKIPVLLALLWPALAPAQMAADSAATNAGTASAGAALAGAARAGAAHAGATIARVATPPASAAAPAATMPLSPLMQQWRDAGREADTATFWQMVEARGGSPLVEDIAGAPDERLVTFLWRGGDIGGVRVVGSPSGDHDPMQRWQQSDIWYRTYRLPLRTRMSYQLAPAVPGLDPDNPAQRHAAIRQSAQPDPLNPHRYASAARGNVAPTSILTLAAAPPQPWLASRPDTPSGAITHHRLRSDVLDNTRDIHVYRSAGYRDGATDGQPLLVMFDAHAYLASVPGTLDNLVADGLLPPMAAVLIANPGPDTRERELPPNDAFQQFLGNELMPWVRTDLGLRSDAATTIIGGSSYGGLASLYAGLRQPGLFGAVLSLSGSYWWSPRGEQPESTNVEPGWMMRLAADMPQQDIKVYLEAGLFEPGRRGQAGILETNRQMHDVLRTRGYDVMHAEIAGGHDYLQWQGSVACGLLFLLADGGTEKADAGTAEAWERACAGR